jgi:2-hydroxychromene-2-carboxylate isomerase
MGDLILLSERRALRQTAPRSHDRPLQVAFFFDLACPFSYLAAERVERLLGHTAWIPAAGVALYRGEPWGDPRARDAALARAEWRADELRLPLVWPDRFPAETPMALRAATYATEIGAGAAFALAASRLAFCGGFDLEDPEILAEAAAAAGIHPDVCLAAAADAGRDGALHATARGLLSRGVTCLPALRVGQRWFSGERGVAEAAAAARSPVAHRRPLAPVG